MVIDLNAILLALFAGGGGLLLSNIIRFTEWFRKSRIEGRDSMLNRMEKRADDAELDADRWVKELRAERIAHGSTEEYVAILLRDYSNRGLTPPPRPNGKE